MLIAEKNRQLVFNLKKPERVLSVIPTARLINYKGTPLVAVPHQLDETKVLRNLGFTVPSPATLYYGFPSRYPTPFEHQKVTVDFLVSNPRAYCLNDMGTAKTLSALWAFDYLRSEGLAGKMLVTAPLSTLEHTWGNEIWRNLPHLSFVVLHGSRKRRLELLKQDVDVYIINHDGMSIIQKELEHRWDITHVIVDEIASMRNRQTDRWETINQVVNGPVKRNVWGMTGTPTPNAPTDAWAQCRLITPHTVPQWFGRFRDMTMRKVTQFKWAPREGALEMVQNAMQPAIRFSRDECIDLPELMYETLHAELTKEQKEMYKQMLSQLVADFKGQQLTAVNEAVKINKLVQICCGVAYDINHNEVYIPVKPRIELTKEVIANSGSKTIVFVPLTGALEYVAAELGKDYSVEIIHGGTSASERRRIFTAFQNDADPQVLVANAGAMSHGLTLTAASTIIWFAPPNSNETYNQANARISRPGQKLSQLIMHIEGTTVERKIYDRLKEKSSMQGVLLDMIQEAR